MLSPLSSCKPLVLVIDPWDSGLNLLKILTLKCYLPWVRWPVTWIFYFLGNEDVMWDFPTLFSQYRHLNSTFKLTNGFLNVCQDLYGMVTLVTQSCVRVPPQTVPQLGWCGSAQEAIALWEKSAVHWQGSWKLLWTDSNTNASHLRIHTEHTQVLGQNYWDIKKEEGKKYVICNSNMAWLVAWVGSWCGVSKDTMVMGVPSLNPWAEERREQASLDTVRRLPWDLQPPVRYIRRKAYL